MWRNTTLLWLTAALTGAIVLSGCPKQQAQAPGAAAPAGAGAAPVTLNVLGPCGMIIPIEEAAKAFGAQNPGIEIKTTYDNSVIIAQKVAKGSAPCDVFISPGDRQLGILKQAGMVDESTITPICTFDVVVIVPKANPAHITKPQDLLKAKVVSMPDANLDSTGYAGRQALTKLKLWDALQKKGLPLTTKDAIVSHDWVAAGRSQAGIAFRNCPLQTNPKKLSLSKVSIAFAFPLDSYVMPQGLVAMTKNCKVADAAKKFITFLASPEGQKVIGSHGLTPLKQPAKTAATAASEISMGTGESGSEAAAAAKVIGNEKKHGDPGAKTLIQVFYPRSGHEHIIKLAYDLADKYPGKVRAEFYDWAANEQDRQVWRDKGLSCGAVLVNGKQTWTIKDAKGSRPVTLMMAMGGEWTKADLVAVVAQAVAKSYPG